MGSLYYTPQERLAIAEKQLSQAQAEIATAKAQLSKPAKYVPQPGDILLHDSPCGGGQTRVIVCTWAMFQREFKPIEYRSDYVPYISAGGDVPLMNGHDSEYLHTLDGQGVTGLPRGS